MTSLASTQGINQSNVDSISRNRVNKYDFRNMQLNYARSNAIYNEVKLINKKSPESKTLVNLIHSNTKSNLTIRKIINTFSLYNEEEKLRLPIFEMICDGEFPIYETLLPLFKRKLITYLNQTQMLENYKKNKEQLNS